MHPHVQLLQACAGKFGTITKIPPAVFLQAQVASLFYELLVLLSPPACIWGGALKGPKFDFEQGQAWLFLLFCFRSTQLLKTGTCGLKIKILERSAC